MNVYGLDLSSTCTGICLPDGTTDHHKPKGTLLERALSTKRWLLDYLLPGADLVVIEDIATRQVQTAIAMAYVHCQVDELLAAHDIPAIKVDPTRLKRFATNKHNADKHAMTMAAVRCGWEAGDDSTDDEADAWWLWRVGRVLVGKGLYPPLSYQAKVLEALRDDLPEGVGR